MTAEMPLLVWTLVLIRRQYPAAAITLLPRPAQEAEPGVVWLVARDGWAAAPYPRMASLRNAIPTEQAGRYLAATHGAAERAPAWERER